MSIVAKDQIYDLLDSNKLEIVSAEEPNHSFDPAIQVGDDGIDLRLGLECYTIDQNIPIIDTLSPINPNYYFKRTTIPPEGFILEPKQFILASTLEIVCLRAGEYIGRINGRSLYARFGLSVHCCQQKYTSGNRSVIPLQLINNLPIPLVIYPRQRIVSFQLELMHGTSGPYRGKFSNEVSIKLPHVPDEERNEYSDQERLNMFHHINEETLKKITAPHQEDITISTPPLVENFDIGENPKKIFFKNKFIKKLKVGAYGTGLAVTSSSAFSSWTGNVLINPQAQHYKSLLAISLAAFAFIFLFLIIFLNDD